MTVKIGVEADTQGLNSELKKVQQNVENVSKAVEGIADASKHAQEGLGKVGQAVNTLTRSADQLKRVQEILSKQLGRPVSGGEAGGFLDAFDGMRQDRSLAGGRRVRQYHSFEDFFEQDFQKFVNRREGLNYQRRVMEMAIGRAGLGYGPGPAPAPLDEGGGGGGGGGGRMGGFRKAMGNAARSASSFGRGMLALAGVNSLMGMAGRAIDSATEEAVTTDSVKRILGDVSVDFTHLRDNLRQATDGLGLTYVESVRLAQNFTKLGNVTDPGAAAAGVRTNVGFARAFGLDPNAANSFFGIERQFGVTKDDAGSRRLALMIAEAVNKGGVVAKTDEVLQAVSNFTQMAARMSLSTPNVGAYAAALAGLTKTGLPGLDVGGAASMLNQADSTIRRGGGMGEASLNFSYGAISRFNHGLNPVLAQAVMQGGLFGSAASTLGGHSAIGHYLGGFGIHLGHLSGASNLTMQMSLMRQQYRNPYLRLDAIKNQFGLSSLDQAAALATMHPAQLGGLQASLKRSGVDLNSLNVSGIQTLGAISAAGNSKHALTPIFNSMMGRSDITAAEKKTLQDAMNGGNTGKLRDAMTKIAAEHDQVQTEGTKTRASITDLNNALTKIGGNLLGPINDIKTAVVRMANVIAPDAKDKNKDLAHLARQAVDPYLSPGGRKALDGTRSFIGKVGNKIDGIVHFFRSFETSGLGHLVGRDKRALSAFSMSPDLDAKLRAAAGGDPQKYAMLRNILNVEQRGNKINAHTHAAESAAHAKGLYQITPGFAQRFGVRDPNNIDQALTGVSRWYDWAKSNYRNNRLLMYADYNGGARQARNIKNHWVTAAETQAYTGMAMSLEGMTGATSTPMPGGMDAMIGAANANKMAQQTHLHVSFDDLMVRHPDGSSQSVKPRWTGIPVAWGK